MLTETVWLTNYFSHLTVQLPVFLSENVFWGRVEPLKYRPTYEPPCLPQVLATPPYKLIYCFIGINLLRMRKSIFTPEKLFKISLALISTIKD